MKPAPGDGESLKEKQARLARIAVLTGLPTLFITLVAAVTSNSIALFADLLLTILDLASLIVVWLVARAVARGQSYHVEFGYGKFESLASAFVGIFLVGSLIIIVALAIDRLVHNPEPASGFGIYAGLTVNAVYLIVNSVMLVHYWRLARHNGSLMARSQRNLFIDKVTSNAVMTLALSLSVAFADYRIGLYVDPIASLILVLSMAYWAYSIITSSMSDLLDMACGENVKLPVLKALANHFDRYDDLAEIRTRRASSTIFIEIELGFGKNHHVTDIVALRRDIQEEIEQTLPHAKVQIIPNLARPLP